LASANGRRTTDTNPAMKIGPVRVAHPILLAPMEEHTNFPFGLLMRQYGASLVCSERVDAVDVARRDRRALRLLYTTTQETPRAGQVSGREPAVMAEVVRAVTVPVTLKIRSGPDAARETAAEVAREAEAAGAAAVDVHARSVAQA